jgi:hypothetical protein
VLRFRFDSEGELQGNLWQIDDVELEAFSGSAQNGDPPGPASNPEPADGATVSLLDADLSWSAGTTWMFTTQDEPAEIIHSDGFEL